MVISLRKIFLIIFSLSFLTSLFLLSRNFYTSKKARITFQETHAESSLYLIQREKIHWSLGILALCITLILFAGTFFIKHFVNWWIISFIVSIIGIIELFFVWDLVRERNFYYFQNNKSLTQIRTQKEQDTFIQKMQKEYPSKKIIIIPTGIFLEHLYIARKDNKVYPGILANGFIWQRYNNNIAQDIERNIIFPDAKSFKLQKIFHVKEEKEELIGWQFSSEMFQKFEVSEFPFDYQRIKIKLVHPNFEKNVVLVPDFESYKHRSNEFFGLSSNFFKLSHSYIHQAGFGFIQENFGTNFGLDTFAYKNFPELIYFILSHHSIWDTAGTYLILLLAIAIILFLTLLAFLRPETPKNLLGFSAIGVIGVCSSLLFVLISSHIALRSQISISGIVYLGWVHIILYFIIVFISINGIIFALGNNLKGKDNFIAITKLLYWPSIIYSLLLVTILKFF